MHTCLKCGVDPLRGREPCQYLEPANAAVKVTAGNARALYASCARMVRQSKANLGGRGARSRLAGGASLSYNGKRTLTHRSAISVEPQLGTDRGILRFRASAEKVVCL